MEWKVKDREIKHFKNGLLVFQADFSVNFRGIPLFGANETAKYRVFLSNRLESLKEYKNFLDGIPNPERSIEFIDDTLARAPFMPPLNDDRTTKFISLFWIEEKEEDKGKFSEPNSPVTIIGTDEDLSIRRLESLYKMNPSKLTESLFIYLSPIVLVESFRTTAEKNGIYGISQMFLAGKEYKLAYEWLTGETLEKEKLN